ncbi:MAG: Na+/H+ antiporter subunit E [Thermodesulfobacteriota bacterium]
MFTTATFVLLYALWLLLSGKFDLFHLCLGALSCALVARLSSDLLFFKKEKGFGIRLVEAGRFLSYSFWLLYQIIIANFHVIGLALSGYRMKRELAPHIFSFKTILRNDFSKFVLANSITLTPGTVTIRIHDDVIYVHAISELAAGELANQETVSEMERRIAMVFERENFCYLEDKKE